MKQSQFLEHRKGTKPHFIQTTKSYGGAIAYRKISRPISTKSGMHVVLKSECCSGAISFRSNEVLDKIIASIYLQGHNFAVKIYKIAVVKNHIHIIVSPKFRYKLAEFLRAIAGHIALTMRRTFKQLLGIEKFWSGRPFTRVILNHFDFQAQLRYLQKNILEAIGFVKYSVRKSKRYKCIQILQNLSQSKKESIELLI